ncbi:hypothetical protein V6Z12_A10G106300 [Gossypium hirsutum]
MFESCIRTLKSSYFKIQHLLWVIKYSLSLQRP